MIINEKIRAELVEAAKKVRNNAYAPYSDFKVGAALLAQSGKIYCGCNFENSSFGAGSCAERVALGAALAAGERRFAAIAVCGGDQPVTPCGICRQALGEFGDIEVLCADSNGKSVTSFMLSELLPAPFVDFK